MTKARAPGLERRCSHVSCGLGTGCTIEDGRASCWGGAAGDRACLLPSGMPLRTTPPLLPPVSGHLAHHRLGPPELSHVLCWAPMTHHGPVPTSHSMYPPHSSRRYSTGSRPCASFRRYPLPGGLRGCPPLLWRRHSGTRPGQPRDEGWSRRVGSWDLRPGVTATPCPPRRHPVYPQTVQALRCHRQQASLRPWQGTG